MDKKLILTVLVAKTYKAELFCVFVAENVLDYSAFALTDLPLITFDDESLKNAQKRLENYAEQISFTKYEREVVPQFKENLNKPESTEDVKRFFPTHVKSCVSTFLREKCGRPNCALSIVIISDGNLASIFFCTP